MAHGENSYNLCVHSIYGILFIIWTLVDISAYCHEIHITEYHGINRFKNVQLNTTIQSTPEVRSSLECYQVCARTSGCKSVNYCYGDRKCVLNIYDVCNVGDIHLLPSPGCNYYDFYDHPSEQQALDVCSPSPCLNGGTCSVCGKLEPECVCPDPYYGGVCENQDGDWNLWSAWATCYWDNDQCVSQRTRQCTSPRPMGAGIQCPGTAVQLGTCESEACPCLEE